MKKEKKTYEQLALEFFKERNIDKCDFWALIEIDSETDADGDEIVLTANYAFVKGNKVYVQDKDYSDQVWELSTLPKKIQYEVVDMLVRSL